MNPKKSIVVATDLCERCDAAAYFAIERSKSEGLPIVFVHGSYLPGNPDNLPPEADQSPDKIESSFVSWLKHLGLDPDSVVKHIVQGANPSNALIQFASQQDPEVIVMGKPSIGLRGILFGNRVSQRVIQNTQVPVTIV